MLIWLVLNALGLLSGMLNGLSPYSRKSNGTCNGRLTRIEYIFPSSALGCWLTDYPDSNK